MTLRNTTRSSNHQKEEQSRLKALRNSIATRRHDHFLVSGAENIRYLTGFTGSLSYLLVSPENVVLYVDGRYSEQATLETEGLQIVIATNGLLSTLSGDLCNRRIRRLAFEQNNITYQTYQTLREGVRNSHLAPLCDVVATLRLIKSEKEIEKLRASAKLNSIAFERACRQLRPHWTESRLAAEIDYHMSRLGADGLAFNTIVASGDRSSLPHARPTLQQLKPKTLIVVDQGAILDGYASDMTRVLSIGSLNAQRRSLFEAVREAQYAAVQEIRSGIKASTVDRKARQVLRKFKLDGAFVHSTGHGVGLKVHEDPRLGPKQETRLAAGMVVTVEPGVYVAGVGGARLEDMVLVKRNGFEILTPTSKNLRQF